MDNTGRIDCNPHHRRPRFSRSYGEQMLAQGMEAMAPSVGAVNAAIRQLQG